MEAAQSRAGNALHTKRAPPWPSSAALLLLALAVGAAYSTGRRSVRHEVAGCAGLAEPKLAGDTVAPEGEAA